MVLPLLRSIDPERAHGMAIKALGMGLVPMGLLPGAAAQDDPRLAVTAFGLRFPNPVGLAAGFDKNADAGPALFRLGFGLVETGTVTPKPQIGNPRPRIFRLTEDQAVINRLGFNNKGLDVYLRNLARLSSRPVPLGANIGINKEGADPVRDYPALVTAVAPWVDYVVINVSSPNTPGLRDLQSEAQLRAILSAVRPVAGHLPILVKVAPDLSHDGLADLVEACVDNGVQGLIVSNTTISRPAGLVSAHRGEAGGLSGRPLRAMATRMLAQAYRLAHGRLTLIGTGGVFSGADVLEKIQAGAALVQLYTGFAYHGPALIPRLKQELLAALDQAHVERVADAVGTRADILAEPS
ncbi:MAG TPA: quinone-dependent dihydroorotate dehydrogenase [Rhodopila sp.]|uniref:quinone-dependent dihydroorotate dehydrogenase n=1 Tax=Rhodopila sp. TaxID=2480087 RepID=UPI002C69131E|nr:quinone-dependent dihydroorotate dehydrogenase [Rhodopila sp.]HVY16155.1 quinone-dependent dihydroorotate dehydrogenase [Rhodopila sp.]